MSNWSDPEAVDRLLFEGEAVTAEVPVGTSRVVVTTHRLLAFTPEGDGPNYAHADLPNVAGVDLAASGRDWLVGVGVRAFVVGIVLLAAGTMVDLGDTFTGVSTTGTERVGVGGILGMLDLLRTAMALLDEALLVGGAVGLVVGLVAVGGHLATRRRELVVRVAGDDDIAVPGDDADEETVERLRAALR